MDDIMQNSPLRPPRPRSGPFWTGWLPGAAALLVACGPTAPDVPPPQPVIEATLIVGHTRDTVLIFYTSRPDQPVGRALQPDPVAPRDVELTLEEVGGAHAPLVADPAQPGHFIAALPIVAERTYRLTGLVRASTVKASVTTPAQMVLVEPVGDTIVVTEQGPSREVRCRFASFGDVATLIALPASVEPEPDTAFVLHFVALPDTVAVTFVGFGRTAAPSSAGSFEDSAPGNITGALGLLTAATTLKRVFVWR